MNLGFEKTRLQIIGLHPNPAQSRVVLSVASPDAQEAKVKITTTLGQQIHTQSLHLSPSISDHDIDLSSLPAGTYFLTLTSTGFQQTRQLIKLK